MALSGERFSSSVFSGDAIALVAGDSNVKRMSYVTAEDSINLLPVPGAKFVRDRKNFRHSLKMEMMAKKYDVVYLHLGSNDVLCPDHIFYRNVSEICDLIHEVSPSTEVVLCEILPRDRDSRFYRVSAQQVWEFQRWIGMANQLLWDFAQHVPYVRYFSYGSRSSLFRFLSNDGLHLHHHGAKMCLRRIIDDLSWLYYEEDNNFDDSNVTEPAVVTDTVGVTNINDEECQENATIDTYTYASVVKKCPLTVVKKRNASQIETVNEMTTEKKHLKKTPRKLLGRKYMYKRQKKQYSPPRCINEDQMMMRLDVHGVSVMVKSSMVQAKMVRQRCPTPCSRGLCQQTRAKRSKIEMVRQTKQNFIQCPDCKVTCSSDICFMDHMFRKHLQQRSPVATVAVQLKTSVIENINITQEAANDQEELKREEEQPHSAMTKTSVEDNVNDTEQRLLLSGDVETNPGPVMNCNWEACSHVCESYEQLKDHVGNHCWVKETNSNVCKWNGCAERVYQNLRDHVLQHVYENEDISTIDDWIAALPGGYDNGKTNLRLCPKRLRSKLGLLLFDEDFDMEDNQHCTANYTPHDHLRYLNYLSIMETSTFYSLEKSFINKRSQYGESWTPTVHSVNSTIDPKLASSKFSYTLPTDRQYKFVNGIATSSNSLKRKRDNSDKDIQRSNLSFSWTQNLFNNLALCNNAIKLQRDILCSMLENNIVSSKKPCFFRIEQELAHLSSIKNCCSGAFSYSAFRCSINNREVYYIRYIESGVYSGLMQQQFLNIIKEQFRTADDNIFLHHSITSEDIKFMEDSSKPVNNKRQRPDRTYIYATTSVLPPLIIQMEETQYCTDIAFHSSVTHLLPYKSKSSIDSPGKLFLHAKTIMTENDIHRILIDFRVNKSETPQINSKDMLNEMNKSDINLLQQSVVLNCLSGDIRLKNKAHLFKKSARFESNFIHNSNSSLSTSLRNRILNLYLRNKFDEVVAFIISYYPELNISSTISDTVIPENSDPIPEPKKRKVSKTINPVKITTKSLTDKLPNTCHIKDSNTNLFESYVCNLLEHGQFYIQCLDRSTGSMVCILNDYSETDGSFKWNDFVKTVRYRQENGDYYRCSCRVFTTLLQGRDDYSEDDVLDATGNNSVTCIHCRFVQQKVIGSINADDSMCTLSQLDVLIKKAMDNSGKRIVPLQVNNQTHKYSILGVGDDVPSFVHLTYNKRLNKFIVSCLNGKCRVMRGHKKSLTNLQSSALCKHLTELKNDTEYWQHMTEIDPTVQFVLDDNDTNEDILDPVDSPVFDEDSRLWNFKCLSNHCPSKDKSSHLSKNVLMRDTWNDQHLERMTDGCLKGPVLFPDIPDNTCECGAGWMKDEDHPNYSENGLTIHEKKRVLTVYTQLAPVKCDIHSRICYNPTSPCKIKWDEGLLDSMHVLSRDTAAGDEIGWEFVSMVFNSDCTFSSFCNIKTQVYQNRNSNASFMNQSVFIKWWFSWAANMKIDFCRPCDICKFAPKRLCCDGTKVGVGFRNADFEEINKTDPNIPVNETLHRRMDRCFLKNMNNLEKKVMIQNRLTLDYLARCTLGEVKPEETWTDLELTDKLNQLKNVLPEEFLPSFNRYIDKNMQESEKLAYGAVIKMLATTASITSFLPPTFCSSLQSLVTNFDITSDNFNSIMRQMRSYCPELRDLIAESMINNNDILPEDIRLLLQYLINESLNIACNYPEPANFQSGTYNPAKFGKAYYFNPYGLKLRNVRKYTIDNDNTARKNNDHDDPTLEFERCQKLYSKVQTSAPGTSNLFLWFCADHGHCYGFHMTGAEGRKDPFASLYSYLEKPPESVFYDFACNLQEYCLNRESGYFKNVRFFHDIFHGYSHKCSTAFRSTRLQGFESVNSEICEQFNSFIQHIKKSARQMSQPHFCFYLQFFLHQWNERKRLIQNKKLQVALSGLE